LNKQSRAADKG